MLLGKNNQIDLTLIFLLDRYYMVGEYLILDNLMSITICTTEEFSIPSPNTPGKIFI